ARGRGFSLSSATTHAAEGVGNGRLGRDGREPARAVLPAHGCRTQAAPRGNGPIPAREPGHSTDIADSLSGDGPSVSGNYLSNPLIFSSRRRCRSSPENLARTYVRTRSS